MKKQEEKLFMQNKCLYRISSLYEKIIDTTGEESIDSTLAMETPERRQLMSLWCFNC